MTRWEYMNCCYGVAEHPRVYTEASGATLFLNGLTGVSKGLRSGLLAVPRPLGAKRQPLSFIPWIRITGFGPIGHPLSKNLRQFQNPFPKERHHLVPSSLTAGPARGVGPSPPACALFREMTSFLRIPLPPPGSALWKSTTVACSRWSGGCKERKRRGSKYVSRNSLSALHLLLFWSQSTCSPGWSQRPSGNTALFINLA